MARRAPALLSGLAVGALLTGCANLPWFSQTTECVSWVAFEDQEMLAESSRLIVVGTVIERSGTADLLGGDARLYRFAVDESSDPRFVGLELEIASRSDGCAADPYALGDQLDTQERIAVFLSTDDQWGGLATVTPFDGVLPAEDLEPGLDTGLPSVAPPTG